jgi:hypothetical protein
LHQDKAQISLRKRNYFTMLSNLRDKKSRNEEIITLDHRERLSRKLEKAKHVYREKDFKRPRPLSPKTKIPR